MFAGFYAGKRVLVTGHTGFKGGWLALWLNRLSAKVHGLSLEPPTFPNLYDTIRGRTFAAEYPCDVGNLKAVQAVVEKACPEVIFHLAAQPLVRRSYVRPIETLATNALGTANILEAVCRQELTCPIIVVTSDKCYENQNWDQGYRETDSLGGHDVYSMSKAAAELVVQAWRRSFFLPNPRLGNVATCRAGNVIGGGDYAEDRIVPDCVRALLDGRPIPVRNPHATRPWQHVLDCLSGYLWLAANLVRADKHSPLAGPFNFGPGVQSNRTVKDLVQEILLYWPGKWENLGLPGAPHESSKLHLATDKAAVLLGWSSTWDFSESVRHMVAWYRQRHLGNGEGIFEFSLAQIDDYMNAAKAKGLAWVRDCG